jgi:ATP-binding cassette subfamily F protein 3
MHLLSLVADRLWLVKDGRVNPYDGDLPSYRKLLLAPPDKPQKEKPKAKTVSRDDILAMRSDVRKCEARVAKLSEMQNELAKRLGDPKVYEDHMADKRAVWQKKYSEVMEAMDRAEAMWVKAQGKLEKAER